jgi:hypothetical protein
MVFCKILRERHGFSGHYYYNTDNPTLSIFKCYNQLKNWGKTKGTVLLINGSFNCLFL